MSKTIRKKNTVRNEKTSYIVKNIISVELIKNNNLLNKMLALVTKVYDDKNAELFLKEIAETQGIVITYMMIGNNVIGLGCIRESYIAYGTYELFWGMVDEHYRGNGFGKILVEDRIKWVEKHYKGLNSPNNVIVITKSPWHLTRCGFEVIKHINDEGEVLMYRNIEKKNE